MKRTPIPRSPFKRRVPLARSRTPLASMSPQRRPMKRRLPKGHAAWVARRDAHLAAHPWCACDWRFGSWPNTGCDGPLDVHHVQPRGMGGTKHDDGPLVTLCRKHHDWVETHREEARARGLLVSRRDR